MEQLVNFIIRPPRAEYDPNEDLLDDEFMLKGKWYRRKDLEIQNSRGDILKCSHYLPIVSPEGKPLPCVIYCHGNSGCRADGSEAAIILLPSNITVFTLDFSGSGLSGGEHVTLGWNEKNDLKAVVDHLRADGSVSLIGLWGRSMGAVTSLMYGTEDPSIAGMVLDSPFSDLVELMMELVDTYKVRLPKFTVKFAIQYMRRVIQKKAKFDIMDLNTIKVAKACFVPVLLGHAVDDDFIQPHHSDRIFEAYMGDKNIIRFEGDHNSPRPQFYFDSINIFFHNVLHPPEDEVGGAFFDNIPDYIGKGLWRTMPGEGFEHISPSTPKDESTSGTVNAIEQVRSKRPMSRTEVPSDIPTRDGDSNTKDMNVSEGHSPSSSDMISFEFSNGHPYGPQVPTSSDDDQYVEYQLDDLAGFPSSAEEEERMLMEALMESLKDLEMRGPVMDQPSTTISGHADSLEKDHKDNASMENRTPSVAESSFSSAIEDISPSSTDTNPILIGAEKSHPTTLADAQVLASQHPSSNLNQTSAGVTSDSSPAISESASMSSVGDNSSRMQSSSDTDVSDTTKATLTVEKNPPTNIMDGFMRRWDLSFFRNSQNR